MAACLMTSLRDVSYEDSVGRRRHVTDLEGCAAVVCPIGCQSHTGVVA